jgi:hypothetical protein
VSDEKLRNERMNRVMIPFMVHNKNIRMIPSKKRAVCHQLFHLYFLYTRTYNNSRHKEEHPRLSSSSIVVAPLHYSHFKPE